MLDFSIELCLEHVQHPDAKAASHCFQSSAEKPQFLSGESRIQATTCTLVQQVLHEMLKGQGDLKLTLNWGSSVLKNSGVLQQVQIHSFSHVCESTTATTLPFSSGDASCPKFKLLFI